MRNHLARIPTLDRLLCRVGWHVEWTRTDRDDRCWDILCRRCPAKLGKQPWGW